MPPAVPPFAYATHTETLRFGPVTLEVSLLDDFNAATVAVHRALAPVVSREVNLDLTPMFGVVWDSARPLAHHLAHEELAGLTLLELGCGLALPSLVAAKRGASVLATDMHPHTGAFLADNAARNGVDIAFAPLDWRRPGSLTPRWDRVVATDVLFAAENASLVAEVFHRALASDGIGHLVDPGRAWLEEFEAEARARGLLVEVEIAEVPAATEVEQVYWLTLHR